MTQSTDNLGSSPAASGQRITRLAAGGASGILLLGLLMALPLGCYEEEWYESYLRRPETIGKVWAVDGERFFVAAGDSVVAWENGKPARVIPQWQDHSVVDLCGTEGELRAVLVNLFIRQKVGSAWNFVSPNNCVNSALWCEGDDIYSASFQMAWIDSVTVWVSSLIAGIHRRHGGEWTTEAALWPNTIIKWIRGNAVTGLWAAGNRVQQVADREGIIKTPVLLRRDLDGWETVDSTHFGEVYRSGDTLIDPVGDDYPVGDVYQVTDLWVDLEGRANLVHSGEGILVHDGTESWMEPTPVPASYRIGLVSMSPDGTLYAVAMSRDSDEEPVFIWVRDAAGWRSFSLGSDILPKGLSAFAGGAILTAVSFYTRRDGDTGKVFRVLPDGTTSLLHMMPLAD